MCHLNHFFTKVLFLYRKNVQLSENMTKYDKQQVFEYVFE